MILVLHAVNRSGLVMDGPGISVPPNERKRGCLVLAAEVRRAIAFLNLGEWVPRSRSFDVT